MRAFLSRIVLVVATLGVVFAEPAHAGLITTEVVDDKGSITIQPGAFQHVFGSHMSVTLGAEWGELAGHFERDNNEKLVWVNAGPPITIHFANVYPKEIHVPQNPNPSFHAPLSFFDIFVELDINDHFAPLEPGMQIQPGPDTHLEGSSGTNFLGIVTPINDLSQLPTSNGNDTQIV